MPMSLDHINIWLLEEEQGWTVVDTCLGISGAKEIWEQLFSGFMAGKPVLGSSVPTCTRTMWGWPGG